MGNSPSPFLQTPVTDMARRTIKIDLRLNEKEAAFLNASVEKSGLSRESYLRSLIKNKPIIERPPVEYFEVLRNLRQINVNLNQIALKANTLGFIDSPEYWRSVDMLQQAIGDMKKKAAGQ